MSVLRGRELWQKAKADHEARERVVRAARRFEATNVLLVRKTYGGTDLAAAIRALDAADTPEDANG